MSNEIKQLKRACHNSRVLENLGSAYPWELRICLPQWLNHLLLASYTCIFSFTATVLVYSRRNPHASSLPILCLPLNQLFISNSSLLLWLGKQAHLHNILKSIKSKTHLFWHYNSILTNLGFQFIVGTYFDWYYDRSHKKGRLLTSVHYFMKSVWKEVRRKAKYYENQ